MVFPVILCPHQLFNYHIPEDSHAGLAHKKTLEMWQKEKGLTQTPIDKYKNAVPQVCDKEYQKCKCEKHRSGCRCLKHTQFSL